MRPSIQDVYGFGSSWVTTAVPSVGNGIFIAEGDLYPEGGYPGPGAPDAQKLFWALVTKVATSLNEANRNNNSDGIRTTITYGEFDQIIDPPGSTNVFRRDVFSLIAYQPKVYTPFDPNGV